MRESVSLRKRKLSVRKKEENKDEVAQKKEVGEETKKEEKRKKDAERRTGTGTGEAKVFELATIRCPIDRTPTAKEVLVLGFLVGWTNQLDSRLRIFSSAGQVLRRLKCNIP